MIKILSLLVLVHVVCGQDMVFNQDCFSSPMSDPSIGSWIQTENGVLDSPVDLDFHMYGFLSKCRSTWGKEHDDPLPYWKWETENCILDNVDKMKFCHVMEHRKGILLVGDSLTRLMTITLASIVDGVDKGDDSWDACDGGTPIKFVRNDYLDTGNTTGKCIHLDGTDGFNAHCNVFADDYTLSSFDTLVVNSGAHPRDYSEFNIAMDASGKYLSDRMKYFHGDKAIYVARNTPPGHWGCESMQFGGPVDKYVAESSVDSSPESYKWSDFEENNVAFENGFSMKRGWWFIDAFTPTLLRADSHIGDGDCLHYCVPGPADHWVTLLYNIIKEAIR